MYQTNKKMNKMSSVSKSSSKNNQQDDKDIIYGLKCNVLKQKRTAEHYCQLVVNTQEILFKSFFDMYKSSPSTKSIIEERLWELLEINPNTYKKCNSEYFGIKTEIKEYENKGGKKHMAHFTASGNYLMKVTKEHPEPMFYEGYFLIDSEDFTINWKVLEGNWWRFCELKDFFKPINQKN